MGGGRVYEVPFLVPCREDPGSCQLHRRGVSFLQGQAYLHPRSVYDCGQSYTYRQHKVDTVGLRKVGREKAWEIGKGLERREWKVDPIKTHYMHYGIINEKHFKKSILKAGEMVQ